MTQIHLNVPLEFWQRLVKGTAEWHPSKTDEDICSYALLELYVDYVNEDITRVLGGPDEGSHAVSVNCQDEDMQRIWDFLAEIHGSYTMALRAALQHLVTCLEGDFK